MNRFFAFVASAWIAIALGVIAALVIILVNVFDGLNTGWETSNTIWIVGAVGGFFIWEIAVVIIAVLSAVVTGKDRF
jgi:hypothetical protein